MTKKPSFVMCAPITAMLLILGAVNHAVAADLQRARDLIAASRFDEAVPLLEAAMPGLDADEKPRAQWELAYSLRRLYRKPEAIAAYRRFLELERDDAARRGQALNEIGMLQRLDGRYEESLETYRELEAHEGIPAEVLAEGRLARGSALTKLGRVDESIAAWRSVGGLDASAHVKQRALLSIGTQEQDRERYAEALAAYGAALELGGENHGNQQARNHIAECEAALSGSEGFYIRPYVPTLTATSARVFWVSREGAATGTLSLLGDDGEPAVEVEAERAPLGERKAFRQVATLEGLEPGRAYRYRATVGAESVEGGFKTPPLGGGRPVRFTAYGDTQTRAHLHDQVAQSMERDRPDFVVHVGDCVEGGHRFDEWKVQMFDPASHVTDEAPIWPARGNHDGGGWFPRFFDREDSTWRDFRYGDAHVFLMDSHTGTGRTVRPRQLEWLESGLRDSDAEWKIVALHHPMVHTVSTEGPFGNEDFLPILEAHGADFVLCGHYHTYQRLLPIGAAGKKPLIHVTTGGGGGYQGSQTPSPLVVVSEPVIHHCLFEVDGDRLTMTAKTPDGRVIDTLEIVKQARRFPQELMSAAVATELARRVRPLYFQLTHPQAMRNDLVVRSSAELSPGDPVELTFQWPLLDVASLPARTELVVSSTAASAWSVEEQTLDLSAGEAAFTAVPGAAPRPGERAVLRIMLRVDGRAFEPAVLPVTVENQ